jgi:8-oxo-dGTP pyrophosphatase MutT (NUDIX family)
VVREVKEETAWRFVPEALLGIYLWRNPVSGRSTLRFAFVGAVADHDSTQPLDRGIVRTHWLSKPELHSRHAQLRSPLVMRCIEDFQRGNFQAVSEVAGIGLDNAATVTPTAVL